MLGYGAKEVDNAIYPRVEGTNDLFISIAAYPVARNFPLEETRSPKPCS